MKHYSYQTTCLLALLLFVGCSRCRAQMKDLVAAPLHIGMTVPENFTVSVNSRERFVASGGDLSVNIQPCTLAATSSGSMAAGLLHQAESLGYRDLSNAETIELNGFKGCYAIGKDGKGKVLVILLANRQRDRQLLILIAYPAKLEKTALFIANSFYAE